MSPEAIQSLIELFGVEKGLHIINLFTAMDDTEIAHQRPRPHPVRKHAKDSIRNLDLQPEVQKVR